jgi:hypothetical protein
MRFPSSRLVTPLSRKLRFHHAKNPELTDFRSTPKVPPLNTEPTAKDPSAELLAQHQAVIRSRNQRVNLRLGGFFVFVFVAIQVLPSHLGLGVGILLSGIVVMLCPVIFGMARADERECRRIGFVCPSCGKPLYQHRVHFETSPLLSRGVCPHCEQPVCLHENTPPPI